MNVKIWRLLIIFIWFLTSTFATGFAFDWREVIKKIEPATATIVVEEQGERPIGVNAPIINEKGIILTNFHVYKQMIEEQTDGAEVRIRAAEKEYEWQLLGADPLNDLALIQIIGADQTVFPFLEIEKDNPIKGEEILSLGAPDTISFTVTTGVIGRSFLDEEENFPYEYIQHSAEIFFGNSGSSIINIKDRIVGINFAGYFYGFSRVAGQNYAIPSGVISRRLERMKKNLKFSLDKDNLGIETGAKRLLEPSRFGTVVYKIEKDSIFYNHLKKNDIILRLENVRVTDEKFLEDVITYSYLPGESINLLILRESESPNIYWGKMQIKIPLPEEKFIKIQKEDKQKQDKQGK